MGHGQLVDMKQSPIEQRQQQHVYYNNATTLPNKCVLV